jgi:hypothetical protein
MKRSVVVLVIVGVVMVVGYLIYGSTTLVQAECQVCVEFQGQSECRRGSGTSDVEARAAAQKAACAVMARGMNETISCQNVRPKTTQCPAPAP